MTITHPLTAQVADLHRMARNTQSLAQWPVGREEP